MYRDPQPQTACADCGEPVPLGSGTPVDFGTGLSCPPCTERHQQLLARLAAKRDRKPIDFPFLATFSIVLAVLGFSCPVWMDKFAELVLGPLRHGLSILLPLIVLSAGGLALGIVARKRGRDSEVIVATLGIALNSIILGLALLTLATCATVGALVGPSHNSC